MDNQQEQDQLKNNILQAIQTGKVKMRPKWHFILKGGLLLVGIILASLTLLYVVSFIVFVMHQTGVWFAPGFGLRGLVEFLHDMPWLMVIAALVFLLLLEILVRRYSFSYGKPLLYTTLAILGFVALGGFVVAQTSLHSGLFLQARDNDLPFAGVIYRQYGLHRPDNVEAGVVDEIINQGYRITNPREEQLEIIVTPQTRFPYGTDIGTGDLIVIMGDRDESSIQAFAVRKIESGILPPKSHHMRMMPQ